MDHALVSDIAICIVAAWLLAVSAQLLKQPLILAYLMAGFVVGPVGSGWITDHESIETISELGLILLLFMIGLEIDLKKMLGAGRLITSAAAAQIVGGFLGGLLFFRWVGYPLSSGALDALYLSLAAALSSTVIIVKILHDKRELDSLAGRITVGVLVLQDLFAILFLALQPNLKDPSFGWLGISLGKVLVLMSVAFVVSRFALPALFQAVARLPELVLVGALAWCFLMAGLAGHLGLSREMGALVAGVAISTFPYTLDVTAKVTSLRDFFVTLFFVGLGMRTPAPSAALVTSALLVSGFLVASRFLTLFPVLYGQRLGHRFSVLPVIHLSQVSELSLVILMLGWQSGQIEKRVVDTAAYAFVILAVVSSYAMARTEGIVRRTSRALAKLGISDLSGQTRGVKGKEQKPRIFMLGFSWTASSLLEEIARKDRHLLGELAVIDFNPLVHQELTRRGIRVIYGDISQRDTLAHAGVAEAETIVCSLPNTVLKGTTNLRLLQVLRSINPQAQIIMHAEFFADVPKLYQAGANYVSVPRLVEAVELCELVEAAKQRLLDEKRLEQARELAGRAEVIP